MVTYAADFETTTDPDDCRVWGYGIAEVCNNPRVITGNSLDDFMDFMAVDDCEVYFHNLGFDGWFILDWLFHHDFTHTHTTPKSGEFSTLINNVGKFFQVTITMWNGTRVTLKDSLKKLPMSVSEVSKAFDLPESKGELDYHTFRPVGHVLTDEERDYIRRDVEIVALALHKQFTTGMKKLTVGSDSLDDFTKMLGRKNFKRLFPILPESMDTTIRAALRGGFTYADPRFRGKIVGQGATYDVNSLYPYVMREKMMPNGIPVYFDTAPSNDPDYPLWVASITFTAKVRRNHIPCIQVKGAMFFQPTEYLTVIDEPVTMVITSVDYELWQQQYDLDIISWNGGFSFRGIYGVFTDYIDKWMQVKKTHSGGMRVIAKLQLNSLYGKFGTNPNVTGKYPVFEEGKVKLVMGPEETREPVYTPVGVFITAYARQHTITAAQDNYRHFAYADTDSLHLLTRDTPKGLTVDPQELGAWKHEYDFDRAIFLRAKQYSEHKTDGDHETHVASMNRKVAETLTVDDLAKGGEIRNGKLGRKTVPGGVVLQEQSFTFYDG